MQDKVSRAQSFPAYRSSARASVHLDCAESRLLLPALATDYLLAFSSSHSQKLQKYSLQPQSSVLPITLLIRLLSPCALSHMSFFSFVCSLQSFCLLCNHVCSLENLVQIDKSQFAFEMWQDVSFSSSLQSRTLDMKCYLCALALLSLLNLSVIGGVAEGASGCPYDRYEGFPAVPKQS